MEKIKKNSPSAGGGGRNGLNVSDLENIMKIAVTYENGNVFQHFGRTEQFKIYTVENGEVVSSEMFSSNGTGHEALAGLLAENSIEVLICGGMGAGAQAALQEAGIEVYSGAEGDTDEAVKAYLAGELVSSGVNCDHHDHEDEAEAEGAESCGGGCGGCGGGCGGCGGGCHGSGIEGPNVGKTCRVHYVGTFNDGTQFDSSYDRGEPLEFVCGAGMMIRGFDAVVALMQPGQTVNVHLMPADAYGEVNPNAIVTYPRSALPADATLAAGDRVYLYDQMGRPVPATVTAIDDESVTFDANHEMAGKELNFKIELLEVQEG